MRTLTDRQREILDFIRSHLRDHRVAPTRPEIAAAVGVKTKSTIDSHVNARLRKGWIELHHGSHRNIRLLDEDLPLTVAGHIPAGQPILADERIAARIPTAIAEAIRHRPDFFLRVEGESLNRLGLVTGTVVAIQSRPVGTIARLSSPA